MFFLMVKFIKIKNRDLCIIYEGRLKINKLDAIV